MTEFAELNVRHIESIWSGPTAVCTSQPITFALKCIAQKNDDNEQYNSITLNCVRHGIIEKRKNKIETSKEKKKMKCNGKNQLNWTWLWLMVCMKSRAQWFIYQSKHRTEKMKKNKRKIVENEIKTKNCDRMREANLPKVSISSAYKWKMQRARYLHADISFRCISLHSYTCTCTIFRAVHSNWMWVLWAFYLCCLISTHFCMICVRV